MEVVNSKGMPKGANPDPRSERPSSQEGLHTIVESIPDAVIVVSASGNIKYANRAANELFGRASEELIGADLGFPLIPGDKAEIEVVRPKGQTITAEARLVETEWNGERARVVSLRDVTDRKQAEERARQLELERNARAQAEAASRAKSEFLATMSHELRTPLNAVIGYSELLDVGVSGPLTPEQRQQVGRIGSSARHLLGLVNEVLDLAKVEAGRLAVRSRAAKVRDAIDDALNIVQQVAVARGVTLSGWGCAGDAMFDGDPDRVRQILVNLLNNAVKFTPPGGKVSIECTVEKRPERDARLAGMGPWVMIRVVDTGIGIPPARISSIFDPFVQVHAGHTRTSDGSGLGLTISRRLARLMGGDLTARSESGKGSTFSLWLSQASVAQREAHDWREESPDVAARLQGLSDVANGVLRELPSLCSSFVDRLRAEAIIPNTHALRSTQLADHVVGYVADMASMLTAIEEARGQPSKLVEESAEILSFIAMKHGTHRARLGCTPDILHREWAILREELERVVRRSAGAVQRGSIAEALIVLERFLEHGEEASVRALDDALASPEIDSRLEQEVAITPSAESGERKAESREPKAENRERKAEDGERTAESSAVR
jgi:signal transduction histidine kinase